MSQLHGEYKIKNIIITGKHVEEDGKIIYLCLVSLYDYFQNFSCIFQSYRDTDIQKIQNGDMVFIEPTNDFCSCYVLWTITNRTDIVITPKK